MSKMPKLKVGRCVSGEAYAGFVEPHDRSWILFVRHDGKPELHINNLPTTREGLDEPLADSHAAPAHPKRVGGHR